MSGLRPVVLLMPLLASTALAQTPADAPAAVPAGVLPAPAAPEAATTVNTGRSVSAKDERAAEDAYLAGAKAIEQKQLEVARKDFERAVQLNPARREYALALIVARAAHVNELLQRAGKAHLQGQDDRANTLLEEARQLDPTNPIVQQHFGEKPSPPPAPAPPISASMAGPVELAPRPGSQDFHLSGDMQSVIRQVYQRYGIRAAFDSSFTESRPMQFDLTGVDFATATRVLSMMTHSFAVPVQKDNALIAHDDADTRERLSPLIEETIYLPGMTQDQMTELANVARNVFEISAVTASPTGGFMLVRGDERLLDQLNATYADMLDGGADVLFDINVYELDRTFERNIGATLPSGASAFPLASAAQNLISANQSLLSEAEAAGALTLTGNPSVDLVNELAVLIAANVSGASQFENLLAVIGHFDGLPFAGIALASGSTFNLLLSDSEVHVVDSIQVRSSSGQEATFKAGSRYPIITASYSNGLSSSALSQLAGLTVNGVSASSLLSSYLGASSLTVPQFQYEDLGIVLKLTPHIEHSAQVNLKLDLKIEALAGSSINSVPILSSRTLASTITVPEGKTAMMATVLDTSESKAIDGLPGLSELPGFQGTDQDVQRNSGELLITVTPHVVRESRIHIASRPLSTVRPSTSSGGQ